MDRPSFRTGQGTEIQGVWAHGATAVSTGKRARESCHRAQFFFTPLLFFLDRAIDISENLGVDLRGGDLSPSKGTGGALSRPVIALLGEGESTLLYFVLILGCLRAGAVPFPISSNNSKEAVEHLLRATSASFVVDCWPKSASMIGESKTFFSRLESKRAY